MLGKSKLAIQNYCRKAECFAFRPSESKDENCVLWIGNVNSAVREYDLLRAAQKHGRLTKFDMPLHKGGPEVGKPRGFCFVGYSSPREAASALKGLRGLVVGPGCDGLVVDYATGNYSSLAMTATSDAEYFLCQSPASHFSGDSSKFSSAKFRDKVAGPQGTNSRALQQKILSIESKLKSMEERSARDLDKVLLPGGRNNELRDADKRASSFDDGKDGSGADNFSSKARRLKRSPSGSSRKLSSGKKIRISSC